MQELREKLAAKGIDPTNMSDEQVRKVAQAMNIELPREVEIVEYKGALYLKSSGVPVPHREEDKRKEGKKQTAKGLFARVEALPQLAKDIEIGLGLLNSTDFETEDDE